MSTSPIVITISRQLGCGGGYLAQRLAGRLGCKYLDHEILQRAAEELGDDLAMLEPYDERVAPLWANIMNTFVVNSMPDVLYLPQNRLPTDRELFGAESVVIRQVAAQESCVIVGRGGFHLLREHPHHIAVALWAPCAWRLDRIMNLYHLAEAQARQMLAESDREREHFLRAMTGQAWMDMRNFHLCLNTGALGLERTETMLWDYLMSVPHPTTRASGDMECLELPKE